jgi:hypothetical protein
VDGTVEGALRAGVAAYSAEEYALENIFSTAYRGMSPVVTDQAETMSDHEKYDSSWDEGNDELWDKKYQEWEKRDWVQWLERHLSFPFDVERTEDSGDAFFFEEARREPFRLGHTMTVLGVKEHDDDYGVIVKVREGRKTGYVPLADTEVISREDSNYWPVREYAVWFANR